ncbi:MAG: conjugal transfer protein TraE, partial [Oscillospiraceae bacterium]|nr:conjugal transfer protein TraE [Oscillospiraceae bacterium]
MYSDQLPRAQRKAVESAIRTARRAPDRRRRSAQDSIPLQRMEPDGICAVTDRYFTKTIAFQDINYQLNQDEDKEAVFDSWCAFLNYFDSSVRFQLSFVNLPAGAGTEQSRPGIPLRGDPNDPLREEFNALLRLPFSLGTGRLQKRKYLTFGVEGSSLSAVRPRLQRIEADL